MSKEPINETPSKEELLKASQDYLEFIKIQTPELLVRVAYERALTVLDELRFRRMEARYKMAQLSLAMAGPEDEDEEEENTEAQGPAKVNKEAPTKRSLRTK